MTVEQMIVATATRKSLDPKLALAVARKESCGPTCTVEDQARVSPAGAIGIFQLMPKTAAWLGVNPYNLAENIEGGVEYLSRLMKAYQGDLSLVLAAYNWGPGNLAAAIASWGTGWFSHAPAETRNYIPTIFEFLGLPWSGTTTQTARAPREGASNTMLLLAVILLGGALVLSMSD